MSTAWLGLGSNQNAQANLRAGLAALYRRFDNLAVSPVYRSAAVGFSGQDFLNCAARISTDLSPVQLKQWLTDLEDAHGRDRSQPKFSDRSLDIDILLYDDRVGQFGRLVLPRGEILEYAHVLKPLADLAPDLKHPVSGQTFAAHWEAFSGDRTLTRVAEMSWPGSG
ncbi:MAG TPA: 2-amino-4-hydroxy-6-hydroxymethyldihydropteridine diphosphokinase [Wenzhouxiangella sp.]|nr:2-amino-4-hydroxy-6-hydroxymethyldihydropteridine diphosphokinase [Wenzhouxiangella sp.]